MGSTFGEQLIHGVIKNHCGAMRLPKMSENVTPPRLISFSRGYFSCAASLLQSQCRHHLPS